jgi:hypothetical protein
MSSNIPKVTPNWVTFGGIIVPAATALMPTEAWRLVSMSMEPDPSLNRFFWPEKLTGAGFAERDLLNEPIDRLPKVQYAGEISAPPRDKTERTGPNGPRILFTSEVKFLPMVELASTCR